MNLEEFIRAVENEQHDRDFSLAELTDVIDGQGVSEAEANEIIARLDPLLCMSTERDEQESYFYLLAKLYFNGRAKAMIENIVLREIKSVDVVALFHCVEIIAESSLPTKHALLSGLLMHDNPAIRKLVNERISR